MGYVNDWALMIGYEEASLDAAPPEHWDRHQHIAVAHEAYLVGAMLYRTNTLDGEDASCSGPFSIQLINKTVKRIHKEARRAGIRDPPSVFTIRDQV